MGRLRRYEGHRYLGLRDTMRVYDCDDEAELAELLERAERDDLVRAKLVQAFAPDTLAEARNRGFERPTR